MANLQKETIRLQGELVLRNAAETRVSLLTALTNDACSIEIDCTEVSGADVSFLQIVLGARRTAAIRGKSIVLSAPPAGALLDALQRSGIVSTTEARGSPDDAFWACEGGAS